PNHRAPPHPPGTGVTVSLTLGLAGAAEAGPRGGEETHVSLFDGSNCGIALTGRPVFSVQHHPEASPGPQDSHYLFRRFVNLIREKRGEPALAERV
ncbi:carbamoyl phosphate synthase small subunit, partial [Mesorhizobium sp. M0213]